MKHGQQLSQRSRDAPQHEDSAAYDEVHLALLPALCTGCGELQELWFGGASSAGREYG